MSTTDMQTKLGVRSPSRATRHPQAKTLHRNWFAHGYEQYGKRMFDVVLSGVIILAILPLLLIGMILAALDGHTPLFGHVRMGQRGRPFRCLKLRTMVQDAESQLAEILEADPKAAAEWLTNHKLTDDPRITVQGRFLRVTFMDELPQLWNVLCGDMSLVGPRPVTRSELARYGDDQYVVLSVRPGMTGAWQVNGHAETSYEDRVRMDVEYVTTLSFWNDLKILLRTVPVVLARRGE